jgi:hypothetical protein
MPLEDLKYVSTGAWGTGLGRPLTKEEGDGNVHTLAEAIQALIDDPTPGVSVTNIAVSGRTVIFYLSDGSTRGPFTLPYAQPRYRGAWTALTAYAVMDIVRVGSSGTFMVVQDHTSAATFDAEAGNSAGDFYLQIAAPTVEPYVEHNAASLEVTDASASTLYLCSYATGTAVTLRTDVEDGLQVSFRQGGEYPITFALDYEGDAIQGVLGYDNATGGPGAVVTAKYANGYWYLWGRLAPVSA